MHDTMHTYIVHHNSDFPISGQTKTREDVNAKTDMCNTRWDKMNQACKMMVGDNNKKGASDTAFSMYCPFPPPQPLLNTDSQKGQKKIVSSAEPFFFCFSLVQLGNVVRQWQKRISRPGILLMIRPTPQKALSGLP